LRDGSSTVPFEQIGQSAVKRLWRQKSVDKVERLKSIAAPLQPSPPVTTAIVSDLHLGAASGRDLLRREPVLARLTNALRGVDELVLLGDVVELREIPLAEAMAIAEPVLAEIGNAMAGRRVTILAGNHDHQLAGPLIERVRLEGRRLEPQTLGDPPTDGPLGLVARALAVPDVRVAYPGVWVRDDVYATHGHYLDVHNTVPSLERLAIGAVQRFTGRLPEGRVRPEDYEAALAPVYALTYSLAQNPMAGRRITRSDRSARAWEALSDNGRRGRAARLFGGIAVPAAVGVLNAAGLGPLSPDLSGPTLRDAALRGMSTVLDRLGVEARHVVFGHTHRSGPHARDRGWGPLLNTGSWIHEPIFLGERPAESPYFPGHCAIVRDSGPPELRRLLDELPDL
jgi:predicted phosphodiesterase